MHQRQWQFKLSILTSKVVKNLQKSMIVGYLIELVQCAYMLFLVVQASRESFSSTSPILSPISSIQTSAIFNVQILFIVYIGYTFLSIVLITQVIVFIYLSPSLVGCNRFISVNDKISLLSSITLWLMQILIIPAMTYVCIMIQDNCLMMQAVPMVFFIIFTYLLLNIMINNYSLYSYFIILIVPIMMFDQSYISQILLLLVTLFKIISKNSIVSKVLLFWILSLIINQLFTWGLSLKQDLFMNFFYIGIFIVVGTFYLIRFDQSLRYQTDDQIIQNILIKSSKFSLDQKITNYLKQKQILKIYQVLMRKSHSIDQNLGKNIQKKLTQKLTFRELYNICQQMLQKNLENDASFNLKFNLINYMMANGRSLSHMLIFIQKNQFSTQLMNFKQKNQFYLIMQKLKTMNGLFKPNKQLQVSQIQQSDKVSDKFNKILQTIFLKMIQFWQVILDNKIKRSEIYEKFQQIQDLRSLLQKQKQKLERLHIFNRFSSVYYNLISHANSFQNQSQEQQNLSSKKQKFSTQDSQQIDIELCNRYIVIEDYKIQKMSVPLANQLGQTVSYFESIQWKQLMAPEIAQYVTRKINALKPNEQSQSFVIPILKGKQVFVACRSRILWYPTLNTKRKFLIVLETMPTQHFLLYNLRTGLIMSYNDSFAQKFNLSIKKINNYIQNQDLRYDYLFHCTFQQSFPQDIAHINQKQRLPAELKMNLSNLSTKLLGSSAKKLFQKVQVRAFQFLKIENINYVILDVRIIQDIINQSQTNIIQNHSVKQDQLNYLDDEYKLYQNQTFYCPIPNSYQGKIVQKISQINNPDRLRLRNVFIVFGFLIFGLSIFQNFYSITLLTARNTSYTTIKQSITKVSDQYGLIYKMYALTLNRYQLLMNANKAQQNRHQSVADIINASKSLQSQLMNDFLNQYLMNFNNQPNGLIQFSYNFDYFNITTNTGESTLMDFIQNFRLNLQIDDYNFLLKNYLSFRKLTKDFQNSHTFSQKIDTQISLTRLVYIGTIIGAGVGIIILFFVSFRIQTSVKQVISIFMKIQNPEIQDKIEALKADYDNYFQANKKKANINQQGVLQGQDITGQQETIMTEEQNKGQLSDNLLALSQKVVSQGSRSSQTSSNSQFSSNKSNISHVSQDKSMKKNFIQPKDKVLIVSIGQRSIKYIFYLFLYGLLIGLVMIDIQDLITEKQRLQQVLNYQGSLNDGRFTIYRLNVDTLISQVNHLIYNTSLVIPVEVATKIDSRFDENNTYTQIANIQKTIDKLLQQNLCAKHFLQVPLMPCQMYFQGVLKRGYSESLISLYDISTQIKTLQFDQLETSPCTQAHCDPYYQFGYIADKLIGILMEAYALFLNMQSQMEVQLISAKYQTSYLKLLIQVFIGIILFFFFYFEFKNSDRALNFFKILPKSIINKIRITNYIRKNNILQKMDYL